MTFLCKVSPPAPWERVLSLAATQQADPMITRKSTARGSTKYKMDD